MLIMFPDDLSWHIHVMYCGKRVYVGDGWGQGAVVNLNVSRKIIYLETCLPHMELPKRW